jgi:hypothetical protein
MAGGRGEEAESLIFPDHAFGVGRAPAILARQPLREGQSGILGADDILIESHPDGVFEEESGRTNRLTHPLLY